MFWIRGGGGGCQEPRPHNPPLPAPAPAALPLERLGRVGVRVYQGATGRNPPPKPYFMFTRLVVKYALCHAPAGVDRTFNPAYSGVLLKP